ncbi:MAG: DUF2793 domain-containing protein [Microvirga sp.]
MTTTPHLALPLIAAAQAQKHVTHNEALFAVDTLLHCAVKDKDLAAPPASPAEGDRYIVAGAATGAWAGKTGQVAARQDGVWRFYPPQAGWIAFVVDELQLYHFNGTAWAPGVVAITNLQNLTLLGIGTAADATNPFSAKLNNELHAAKTVAEGGTGNIQVKISKESAAKTASHLFQTNFSGRAELGLTGDDNLHVKVSADGAAWIEALVFAAATGAATFGAPTVTAASAASGAGLRLPHGVAPTAPVNGDLWSTTAGWFVRTNGATQQLEVYNAAATFAGVNVGGALTGATAGSFSGAVSTAALSATSGTFTSALSVNNGAELNVWGPGSTVRLRFVNDGTTGYLQGAALNLCGIGGGNTVATVTGSLQVAGVVSPGADNTYTLGSASLRWSQLYAATATINTSDPREKTALAAVPEALLDAILAVPIGAYQWLDSVARKGPDQARIHFGPTAQDVRDAILAKGLDPERFALFCKDPKLARVAKTRIVTRPVAPEIVRIEKVVIEGGRAILKAIAEERAVTRKVTVEDENGAPVMRSMPVAGADSSHDTGPAFEPLTAEIPVTEEVEETYETFEPVTGEFVYGLRLEQFYSLLGLAIRRKAGF